MIQAASSTPSRRAAVSPAETEVGWQPIVIGVDGSTESVQAAVLGGVIAARAGVACRLVHVVPDYWVSLAAPENTVDPVLLAEAAESQARTVVCQALQGAASAQAIASLDVRSGRAPLVLDQVAAELGAGLVMLGGKRRRALTRIGGSTVTHMVRMGRLPILATDGATSAIRRILVAVDLSYAAAPAIRTAMRWAALLGAQLRVLHAVEAMPIVPGIRLGVADDEVFRSCERAIGAEVPALLDGCEADIVVRRGRPAAAITTEVRQWRADLVVVGSHGKGWADRLLIGSTSERLLNVLPTSVLVVPVSKPADLVTPGRIVYPWEPGAR